MGNKAKGGDFSSESPFYGEVSQEVKALARQRGVDPSRIHTGMRGNDDLRQQLEADGQFFKYFGAEVREYLTDAAKLSQAFVDRDNATFGIGLALLKKHLTALTLAWNVWVQAYGTDESIVMVEATDAQARDMLQGSPLANLLKDDSQHKPGGYI